MRRCVVFFFIGLMLAGSATAQKQRSLPPIVPAKESSIPTETGLLDGRIFESKKYSFTVTVPDSWFVAGADFEKILKDNGHDLGTEAVVRGGRPVEMLLTAFRSQKGRPGAVLRVTAESIADYQQIRDAVDYLDAITAIYASVTLPPGFAYSSVRAEQLGPNQFAYLNISTSAGKKRMYATVRGRWAILFTVSYFDDIDLQAVRDMLGAGKFVRRNSTN
jgi:hypothetical protein